MKKMTSGIMGIVLVVLATSAWAQEPPQGPQGGQPPMQMGGPGGGQPQRPGGQGGGDPLMENFFPPELVMQNQGMLGLSEEQKTTIREAMQKSMEKFTGLQWEQSEATETLSVLMKQDKVDEAKILAQLEKVLKAENEIKRMHLQVLVKIRNTLTAEQQAKLQQIKQGDRHKQSQMPHPPSR